MLRVLAGLVMILGVPFFASRAMAEVRTLHTYGNSQGHEIINVIAVDLAKLSSIVPPGYTIVPAAAVGFGGQTQGVVAIANFQSLGPTIDGRNTGPATQVAIDIAVLVAEPTEAASAGLSIPGAYHLYPLSIRTDDARYAASLQETPMPIKFVEKIIYQRAMDDATGAGTLTVLAPARSPILFSTNASQGYVPQAGAFNAVFWSNGRDEKYALHFLDRPYRSGQAISQIYTAPGSDLDRLLAGGGLGPCARDPQTGFNCVIAPSLNLRYDQGTVGTLQRISGPLAAQVVQ